MIAIGECKAKGEVDENDLQNLGRIRRLVRDSGIECTLVFGVLRDEFSHEELGLLRDLAEECMAERSLAAPVYHYVQAPGPILFTNRELESDLGLLGRRDDSLPHPTPYSLQDLAENSQARYLEQGSVG
jgi:hypothetical protein